jgi:hypothetical protein
MLGARGRGKLAELATTRLHLPDRTAFAVDILLGRIEALDADIARIEKKLIGFHKTCEECCNLATIPSVGPLTATLIVTKIGGPSRFKRGRNFTAWLGMVPPPELQWWEGSSGGDHESGGPVDSADAIPWSDLLGMAGEAGHLARQATWAQTRQAGSHGAGQQDRQDYLGGAHPW